MKCEDCGDKVTSDCWCQDGKPVTKTDEHGTTRWYLNDKLHREDGPAAEYATGGKYWYLNGEEVTEEEVMNPAEEMTMEEICKALGKNVKVIK